MVWSRTYCCCAVPLCQSLFSQGAFELALITPYNRTADNSGIYAIIAQFLVVSLVTGVLAFAAPKSVPSLRPRLPALMLTTQTAPLVVAVAIPSWGPYLFGSVCIVVAVAQVVGFFGVYREKPKLFKL